MAASTELHELRAHLQRCLDALENDELLCCHFLMNEYRAYEDIPGYHHAEPEQNVRAEGFTRHYEESGLVLRHSAPRGPHNRVALRATRFLEEKYVRILLVFLDEGKVELPDGTMFRGIEKHGESV
ncbi:hypothetical protein W97_05624 [Coniosporium apollinis CBS 100218]|uniref:Uncharacterized protein n=1 Tax=Coniosporium apollinis (strain CBS 100218) TaxID=1168221 RepID=R7YX48_CONA1|nr:uncharacterized protein W97_05624 [Coniosporium apollinis CBS 100218]EON66231.1 hypothetical protein W97_05624 [Coniosporium apollinis CBS 100218]